MLRHLLGAWIGSSARETVRNEVLRAAREKVTQTAAAARATSAASHCRVGLVFALGIEAGGLVDLLDGVVTTALPVCTLRRGRLRGREIVLVESGAGARRAARATEILLEGHRPDWVISAGFAGGLDPRVKRHDIVLAEAVVEPGGRAWAIDLSVDAAALGAGIHVGRVLSVERIVRRSADKEVLGRRHEALAVDLESLAVAEVCRQRQARFLAVRIVTDAMDEQLPVDIQRLSDQPSTVSRLGAAVGAIWRRPGSLKDMYALRENALLASDRLARFLAGVVEVVASENPASEQEPPQQWRLEGPG